MVFVLYSTDMGYDVYWSEYIEPLLHFWDNIYDEVVDFTWKYIEAMFIKNRSVVFFHFNKVTVAQFGKSSNSFNILK